MATTRRAFLISAAAIPMGCVAGRTIEPSGATSATVRAAAVGQTWRYAKHDFFTHAQVDTQVDQVVAVGPCIEIASHSEAAAEPAVTYPSWGADWSRRYLNGGLAHRPPSEIQAPWGMVVIDPHWPQLQAYEKPIPQWPAQLRPGWSTSVTTNYKIPGNDDALPWQLTMHAQRWESITVPAGRFTALRYFNLIDFRYTNISGRVAGQRKETIWLAPELGRWVARESSGTFRQDVAEEFNESSYRWELLGWS